jgi:hypothetical protein
MSRSTKITPEPGLPREQKDTAAWMRQLVNRLFVLFRQFIDQINLLLDGYLLPVSALPTISATHRGRFIVLNGGAGVIDKLYWARKKADDTYEWIEVVP